MSAESGSQGFASLRHARAREAHAMVLGWHRAERLKKHVAGLPVLLRSLGLAQGVCLLASRAETHELADNLVAWIMDRHPARPLGRRGAGGATVEAFLEGYTGLDLRSARALDEEALRFSEVLKLVSGALHGE